MPTRPSAPHPDPVQSATADAIAVGLSLLHNARHAALAVIDPATGGPGISRIAFGLAPDGGPVTLISTLAAHSAALQANPAAAVMVGEPGARGDPLTHPRLMMQVVALIIPRDDPAQPAIRAAYLRDHPKAKLYVDFADFTFVRLVVQSALLNGGFGKAHRLTPQNLGQG